jgi:hypothetical protein
MRMRQIVSKTLRIDYFNILTYFSKELHVLPDDDRRSKHVGAF